MHLLKVYSNKESFKTVNFNKTGLSFIVARQEKIGTSDNKLGKTYNGVGKSLLVRIIHFCLGASTKNYKSFCEKLPGWEFYIDFEINNVGYTVMRTTENPNQIIINNELEPLSIDAFNKKMQSLTFNIPADISFLSFRSLIPFFIRPNKESYSKYDSPAKTGGDYQRNLYNAFLLGLDVTFSQRKHIIKKELDQIKTFENNFRNDSLLRDFFVGNKDITLTLIDLEEQIKRFDEDLKNFKIAEDYYDVQLAADKLEKELFGQNNKAIMLKSNIESITRSLEINPDISKEKVRAIYSEAKIYFSENLLKTLDDLDDFYMKLVTNRKKRLLEQQNKIELELQKIKANISKLQKDFDKLMQYLGEHQALDLYMSINNRRSELKNQSDNLKKYQELQLEYKAQTKQFSQQLSELGEVTENYLKKIEPDTVMLRDYFRNLAKVFYPTSVSGLTIKANDGENQVQFDINAKIDSDESDGINNVKIFCYDLTILFKGYNHKVDFIFHDSRIFDGVDERQKTDIIKISYHEFTGTNKQYIATVNQNQLEEVRAYLSEDEFKKIITRNVVLTLTDESDAEKLLGIKVDLGEK